MVPKVSRLSNGAVEGEEICIFFLSLTTLPIDSSILLLSTREVLRVSRCSFLSSLYVFFSPSTKVTVTLVKPRDSQRFAMALLFFRQFVSFLFSRSVTHRFVDPPAFYSRGSPLFAMLLLSSSTNLYFSFLRLAKLPIHSSSLELSTREILRVPRRPFFHLRALLRRRHPVLFIRATFLRYRAPGFSRFFGVAAAFCRPSTLFASSGPSSICSSPFHRPPPRRGFFPCLRTVNRASGLLFRRAGTRSSPSRAPYARGFDEKRACSRFALHDPRDSVSSRRNWLTFHLEAFSRSRPYALDRERPECTELVFLNLQYRERIEETVLGDTCPGRFNYFHSTKNETWKYF